jgi:AraC-like DNA-binding protein
MKGPTILGTLAARVLQVADARGVDLTEALRALHLSREALAAEDARVADHVVVKLWEAAAHASGDPDFGLHVGADTTPAALGSLGYALATSATIGDAVQRCVRYARLLDTAPFEIAEVGNSLWIRFRPGAGRQYGEAFVAATVAILRRLTGSDVRPSSIFFEHPAPDTIAEHCRLLAGTPVFDHPAGNWVAFDASILLMPCVGADPILARHLDRSTESAIATLPIAPGVRAKVHEAILAHLAEAQVPTAESIARRLAVTTRTLRRQLRAEGATFAGLVDRARLECALRLLRDVTLGTETIALQLGFSEMSAFSRAFRRWTGQSPAAFRRRLFGVDTST